MSTCGESYFIVPMLVVELSDITHGTSSFEGYHTQVCSQRLSVYPKALVSKSAGLAGAIINYHFSQWIVKIPTINKPEEPPSNPSQKNIDQSDSSYAFARWVHNLMSNK